MNTIVIQLLLATLVTPVPAYHVLVVFPFPTKSHSILGDGFVRNLLNAGHEVTYVTATPSVNPTLRLHQVNVSDNYKFMGTDKEAFLNIDKLMKKDSVMTLDLLMMLCLNIATNTLRQPESQQMLVNPSAKYDAVIAEWMFTELFSGLGVVFDCPLIWSSSLDSHWMIRGLMDEVTNPAYTADYTSTNIPPFNFLQRVEELWFQIKAMGTYRFLIQSQTEEAYEKIFSEVAKSKGITLPSLEEASRNASLMFLNAHISFGSPSSIPHNFKYIGGYHIDTPIKPLPENLKKIMDTAKHGVIYFSMGSVLKSRDMPLELKKRLLKMFSKLKQTVIWKFEEVLDNMPENVHIVQWAPQPSILNHPNCILFITHGGLLSTTEAIHSGVPLIGIPMFADQFNNMEKAEHKGFAKIVDLTDDTPEQLFNAINEMLTNPRYKDTMKHISELYHDRPQLPAEELVYWVEHVIRTKGANHLRSSALLVPWYQKMYLDLLLTIVIIMTLLTHIVKKVMEKLTNRNSKRKYD